MLTIRRSGQICPVKEKNIHNVSSITMTFMFFAIFGLFSSFNGPATAQGTPTAGAEIPSNLAAPATSILLFDLHASGVQIYTCEEIRTTLTVMSGHFPPEADLLNSRGELVGTHLAGPTWQGTDGSAVVGAVLERADAPDATAIPWLFARGNRS